MQWLISKVQAAVIVEQVSGRSHSQPAQKKQVKANFIMKKKQANLNLLYIFSLNV